MLSEKTLIFLYISFMSFKFILLSKGYFLFLCVGCSNWDVLLSRKHSVLFHISTSSKIYILFPRQQSLFLVITTWSCTHILKRHIWDYSGTRNISRSGRGLNCRLLKISLHASQRVWPAKPTFHSTLPCHRLLVCQTLITRHKIRNILPFHVTGCRGS